MEILTFHNLVSIQKLQITICKGQKGLEKILIQLIYMQLITSSCEISNYKFDLPIEIMLT